MKCIGFHSYLAVILYMAIVSEAGALTVTIKADRQQIPMGKDVRIEAQVKESGGKPVEGCQLLPYVNQRRWGAHERTDANGRAAFQLPLPNPGPAEISVLLSTDQAEPKSWWIWPGVPADRQNVWMAKTFTINSKVESATLYAAVDDQCSLFLNGEKLGETIGWQKPFIKTGLAGLVKSGSNLLAISAHNFMGPAGLLARLELETDTGPLIIETDSSWIGGLNEPPGWPETVPDGKAVMLNGRIDQSMWSPALKNWPGYVGQDDLMTGRLLPDPLPAQSTLSNRIMLTVTRRAIPKHKPCDSLIGMQWEPWFTPKNAYWQTAQAVPVVGFYDSYNRDVLRQHILWFADLGIDFVMPDWSNHLWGKKHWNERPEGTNEIIHATSLLLETLAEMKEEGIPVPKVVLMPGLSNGEPTTVTAINEQLEWVYDAWVKNPRFEELWLDFDGKPLIVILDTGTVASKDPVPVDESHWTVRWMSTQLQITHHDQFGYWSWMDGCLYPIVTYRDGRPEVVTPTPAYFGNGGWLYPEARGRRNGSTLIESFKPAFEKRPRVVLLHQWNEYAGQIEGQGYGDKHDIYVDSYSVELSDDLEPVSTTAPGYRGDPGGWGYYYMNLTRAILSLYRGDTPDDTLLAIESPLNGATVSGDSLNVTWSIIGKIPKHYTLQIDGRIVVDKIQDNTETISIKDLQPGEHTLAVLANGATSHFALSETESDRRLEKPVPARSEIRFILEES